MTGPATLAAVKRLVSIPEDDTTDDADLQLTINGVNDFVTDLPIAYPRPAEDEEWRDRIVLGATMLCARMWRRRSTPGGVEATGEFGVAYVRSNDPDVAQLLQLGAYAAPVFG